MQMRVGSGSPERGYRVAQRSFTLVELLLVVATMMILASLLLPALTSAVSSAKTTQCANNLFQCGQSVWAYANDSNGFGVQYDAVMGYQYRQRYWADILMQNGYLQQVSLASYYTGTMNFGSKVPFPNLFSCPETAPPASHVVGGNTISDGFSSTKATYGVRSKIDWAYSNERYVGYMPRLASLRTNVMYLGDSLCILDSNSSGPRQGTLLGPIALANELSQGQVYVAHRRLGNFWFPDGRVQGLEENKLSEIRRPDGNPLVFIPYLK